mgnify:CR=1 FL=1
MPETKTTEIHSTHRENVEVLCFECLHMQHKPVLSRKELAHSCPGKHGCVACGDFVNTAVVHTWRTQVLDRHTKQLQA